jgi:hypothetical protein
MFAFTYPFWSILPLLFMILAGWLALLLLCVGANEIVARHQAKRSMSGTATFNVGKRHQRRPS